MNAQGLSDIHSIHGEVKGSEPVSLVTAETIANNEQSSIAFETLKQMVLDNKDIRSFNFYMLESKLTFRKFQLP